jgi:hypothetical protein
VITKEDWNAWRLNPVTKLFYEACQIRIEDAKDILAVSAGIDPVEDNKLRGFILAYTEMQDFRVDDLEEET